MRARRILLGLPVAIMSLFFTPSFLPNVSADTIPTIGANPSAYQSPTGTQCNINVPLQYSTIQAGVNAASPGNTVCVSAGTYNENVYISKSLTLAGAGLSSTTIQGQITNDIPGYYTVFLGDNNITIEGFTINGVGTVNGDVTIGVNDGARSGINISYNRISSGNGAAPMHLDGYQINDVIHDNIFEENNSVQGVWVGEGENVNFLNNTFIGTVASNGDILVDDATNSSINRNVFDVTGNAQAVVLTTYPNVVNENNLNTGTYKVYNYPEQGTINAENNWWGDTDPSDNIVGDVDYNPLASSPFPEYSLQTPVQSTQNIINLVQTFNLQQGISNSFDAKLNAAVNSLTDVNEHNNSAAINSLQSFINAVEAQRGVKITNAQADTLIQNAQAIINQL